MRPGVLHDVRGDARGGRSREACEAIRDSASSVVQPRSASSAAPGPRRARRRRSPRRRCRPGRSRPAVGCRARRRRPRDAPSSSATMRSKTSGCTIASRRLRAPSSLNTSRPMAGRSSSPSGPSSSGPNSLMTAARPGVPFATTSRARASASMMTAPCSARAAETVLFPDATPPVSPTRIVMRGSFERPRRPGWGPVRSRVEPLVRQHARLAGSGCGSPARVARGPPRPRFGGVRRAGDRAAPAGSVPGRDGRPADHERARLPAGRPRPRSWW